MQVTLDSDDEWWGCANGAGWTFLSATPAAARDDSAPHERPSFGVATQLAECRADGEPLVIVFAHFPQLTRDVWRSLAAAAHEKFAGAPVLVVLEVADGRLVVDTSFCERDETQRDGAFMVAAIVQVRWAWDDSERMRIESGRAFVEVEPRFDGQRWRATIVSRGSTGAIV